MDIGEQIYVAAFLHAMGYADLNYSVHVKNKKPLSNRGRVKLLLIKIVNLVQSDTAFKMFLFFLTINALYERLNCR